MSAVVSGVKAKLNLRLPGQIGSNRQWSDAYVETLALSAAHAACERIGYLWVTQIISLVNNTHEYALNSTIVAVHAVKYAADGTNYNDSLSPAPMQKFDRFSYRWRQERGTQPAHYALLSAPGTQNVHTTGVSAKISVYPAMSSVGSAKIKVEGVGIGGSSTNVPDDVQERVHVPYVLSILRATQNPEEAAQHYAAYLSGCSFVKGRFVSPYAGGSTDHNMPPIGGAF